MDIAEHDDGFASCEEDDIGNITEQTGDPI
jgi:hypothetical protein